MFPDISFHQKTGKDGHAKALRNGFDNSLGAGTLPQRADCEVLQSETGVQNFSPGAALFAHEKRIFCELGQRDGALLRQRMGGSGDGAMERDG